MSREIENWTKYDNDQRRHHSRYVRFVESLSPPLTCQECGGSGGSIDPVLDYGLGPFIPCGCCEGTGLVTPHARGRWLSSKRVSAALRAVGGEGENTKGQVR